MLATLLAIAFFQGPVVINEFAFDDSGSDDREYVELYNRTGQTVDISGWKLVSEGPNGPIRSYTVNNNTTVAAGAFYVMGSTLVPNVNQVVGSADLWGNDLESLTLVDKTNQMQDSLVYEANKGIWASARTRRLVRGDGVWGNFVSIDTLETSWQRIRDGFDFNNNRIFHLLPWTPGKTNNRQSILPYAQTFERLQIGGDVPQWGGSFRMPKVIDPTKAGSENPNAIAASPQGGQAGIFWDNAGGGNCNMLLTDWVRNIVVEAYVYFDAKPEAGGFYETWSLGVQGTSGTFGNHPDPSKRFGFTANGNTGVCVIYQVTDAKATLYLVDCNDGGWGTGAATDSKVLGQVDVKAGVNDGWQRLRLEVQGSRAEARFGGTYGCGNGVRLAGTISAPAFGGVYVAYREFIQNNATTRPFTCDRLEIRLPSAVTSTYGTAVKTTKGTPSIGTGGAPLLGFSQFAITGSGLVPSSATLLVLGLTQANIDLGAIGGQQGSRLLTLPLALGVAPTDAQGNVSVTVPLPCDPNLDKAQLYWQILDPDPALQIPVPLGNSEGLITTLGR